MRKIIFSLTVLSFLLISPGFVYAQQKVKSSAQKAVFQKPVVQKPAAPKADTQRPLVPEYAPPQPPAAEAGGATFLGTLFKFAFSLVVIIVLVYFTVFMLRTVTSKYRPSSILEGGMFDILDSVSIGPQRSIYLVGINQVRILVLSISDKDVVLLDKIEDAQQVRDIFAKSKDKVANVRTFKEHFKGARQRKAAQDQLRLYFSGLTDFLRGSKKS